MPIFIGLYEELFEGLSEPYPGCLFAVYLIEMRAIINIEFELSRKDLSALIRQISHHRPPRIKPDPVSLADGFMKICEGAFILSKLLHEADITVQQLRH